MPGSSGERQPLFKTKESPEKAAEKMYNRGVRTAFALEAVLFAQLSGKSPHQTFLSRLGIDASLLSADFVAGFSHVMTVWLADVAAASRQHPETLPIPTLPKDSLIAQRAPALFDELSQEVQEGARHAAAHATTVKKALKSDPTGRSYIQERLSEYITTVSPTLQDQTPLVEGMRAAVRTLEEFSERPLSSPQVRTR